MSDLIGRQAAIEALVTAIREDPYYDSNEAINGLGVCDVRVILNDLPSAQPERKKGTWIDHTDDGYVECPFCGSATNCDGDISELHYCFSCGADLKGGEKHDD